MEAKTKAYRIGKMDMSADSPCVYEVLPARYATEESATKALGKFRESRYTKYLVIHPDNVRTVIADIRAKTVLKFLRGRGFQVACDYDDARDRLLKLAGVAEKNFERQSLPAPRKGFLQTEVGLEHLFEIMHLLAERRRVMHHSLTPEETARSQTYDRYANQRISFRDMLCREFDKEAETKATEMALASIHKDEY